MRPVALLSQAERRVVRKESVLGMVSLKGAQWDIQVEVSRRQLSMPDWSLQDKAKLEIKYLVCSVLKMAATHWIDLFGLPGETV